MKCERQYCGAKAGRDDVFDACREEGVLVISAGANILRLAPALVIEEAELAHGLEVIARAILC